MARTFIAIIIAALLTGLPSIAFGKNRTINGVLTDNRLKICGQVIAIDSSGAAAQIQRACANGDWNSPTPRDTSNSITVTYMPDSVLPATIGNDPVIMPLQGWTKGPGAPPKRREMENKLRTLNAPLIQAVRQSASGHQ